VLQNKLLAALEKEASTKDQFTETLTARLACAYVTGCQLLNTTTWSPWRRPI